MTTKSEIINDLREYTSEQIAEAINAGVVTMYELSKSGNLTPLMRRRIEEKLALRRADDVISTPIETNKSNNDNIQKPQLNRASVSMAEEAPAILEAPIVTATAVPTFEATKSEPSKSSPISDVPNRGMFQRPFSFHGRIRRMEYGISFAIYFIWAVALNIAAESNDAPQGLLLFFIITYIPMMWFVCAQNCKRCHDRGNCGWYQLIPFYFFVLLFGDGEEGTNIYGNNPKE